MKSHRVADAKHCILARYLQSSVHVNARVWILLLRGLGGDRKGQLTGQRSLRFQR